MLKLILPLWFITCFISKTICKILFPEVTVPKQLLWRLRDSLLQEFQKKVVLRNILKFKVSHLYQSLFNKVTGLQLAKLIKKGFGRGNFSWILRGKNRATVQQNTSGFASSLLRNISLWFLQLSTLGILRYC